MNPVEGAHVTDFLRRLRTYYNWMSKKNHYSMTRDSMEPAAAQLRAMQIEIERQSQEDILEVLGERG